MTGGGLIALALGVAAGAGVFALLAEQTLGGEAATIRAKFGLPAGTGGTSQLLSLLDVVDPGASNSIKTGAVATAVGGAATAIVVYAVASSLLGS